MARPMPREAPVTSAVFPARLPISMTSLLSLRLEALDQRGGRSALKRQAVSHLSNQSLFDRLHEVDARIAARDLRLGEQVLRDLLGPRECPSARNHFGDHAEILRLTGAHRLRIEQHRLRAAGTEEVAP